jgi:hypothetical protein
LWIPVGLFFSKIPKTDLPRKTVTELFAWTQPRPCKTVGGLLAWQFTTQNRHRTFSMAIYHAKPSPNFSHGRNPVHAKPSLDKFLFFTFCVFLHYEIFCSSCLEFSLCFALASIMAAIMVREIPGVGGVGDVEIDELRTLQAHNGPSRVWCRGRRAVFVIGPWLPDNGGTI